MKLKLFTSLLFIIAIKLSAQTVTYVDVDATGLEDGTSWENAFTDLESAIIAAPSNSEIWITRNFENILLSNSQERDKLIEISKNLHFFGGFDIFKTTKDERDYQYKSRLRGFLENNEKRIHAFNITADSVSFDNIEFAYFNGENALDDLQGIISVDSLSTLTINQCTVTDNEANYFIKGSPSSRIHVLNTTFSNNNTESYHELIRREGNSKVWLDDCILNSNGEGYNNLINEISRGSTDDQLELWDQELLLNVNNTKFINNEANILYSYYGSVNFDSCTFFMSGNSSQPITVNGQGHSILSIKNSTITGSHQGTVVYAGSLKECLFDGVTIDNPSLSDCGLYFSRVEDVNLVNSNFNDFSGSQSIYFYTSGTVTLKNSNFNRGTFSSYLLYVNAPNIVIDGCLFDENDSYFGNYYYGDTMVVKNTTFKDIDTYSILYAYNLTDLKVDSCKFLNMTLSDPLIGINQGNVTISNSEIDNLQGQNSNPYRPLLFHINNSNSKLESINNSFTNVNSTKLLAYSSGELILFGNIIETADNVLPLFENKNTLSIYNSNIKMGSIPLVELDTTYLPSENTMEFNLINSIIYSDTTVLLQKNIGDDRLTETISNNVTNQFLTGNNNTNNSSESFQSYQYPEDFYFLVDKGTDIAYNFPDTDLQGNQRVMFERIDIGAIESQQLTVGLDNKTPDTNENSFIYPNPVNKATFTIKTTSLNSTLEVRSTTGELEGKHDLIYGENTINSNLYTKGVHILTLLEEGEKHHLKIIIE